MRSLSTLARRSLVVLAASGALVMTSCSNDDGLGRRYPVSGTVTYNGNPLEKGVISFVPEDSKGVGATGAVVDGSYKMGTGGQDDGARAGKYKVTITSKEDTTAKAKAAFEKARSSLKNAAGTEGIGVIPREFVRKAEAEAKSLIPPGYGDVRSTNLTAEVKDAATKIDFKLSDADAPPAPQTTTTKGRPGR